MRKPPTRPAPTLRRPVDGPAHTDGAHDGERARVDLRHEGADPAVGERARGRHAPRPRPDGATAGGAHGMAPPAFRADIVPRGTIGRGALVAVIAIMTFLASLTVGTVGVVERAARDWVAGASGEMTVYVRPVAGLSTEERIADLGRRLEGVAGVAGLTVLGEEETEALVAPWLGSGVELAELPVPRVVTLSTPDPAAVDRMALVAAVGAVEGAILDDHSAWTAQLSALAVTVTGTALGLLALILASLALAVVFATRAAMAANQDTIAVLNYVGAEPATIARAFQRHFLGLALKGAGAGAVAALALFLFADSLGPDVPERTDLLVGSATVGPWGYLGVAAILAVVVLLVVATVRASVRSTLRRSDP